jgi:hypothetical protein
MRVQLVPFPGRKLPAQLLSCSLDFGPTELRSLDKSSRPPKFLDFDRWCQRHLIDAPPSPLCADDTIWIPTVVESVVFSLETKRVSFTLFDHPYCRRPFEIDFEDQDTPHDDRHSRSATLEAKLLQLVDTLAAASDALDCTTAIFGCHAGNGDACLAWMDVISGDLDKTWSSSPPTLLFSPHANCLFSTLFDQPCHMCQVARTAHSTLIDLFRRYAVPMFKKNIASRINTLLLQIKIEQIKDRARRFLEAGKGEFGPLICCDAMEGDAELDSVFCPLTDLRHV